MKPPDTTGLVVLRIVIVVSALLGVNYIVWRWTSSVNWHDWWIAVPLVSAETYSVVASLLFGFTLWRLHRRPSPPAAPPDLTVDVVVSAHDEPLDVVIASARAASAIRYPHTTWILDHEGRPEFEHLADENGIRLLTWSAPSADGPGLETGGALSDAMLATDGEFILFLTADQVPDPEFLDHTLGYFVDDNMALVQTPLNVGRVRHNDPYGRHAPHFFETIQRGRDGWNAAYFCGSNAVVRREALAQLGVKGYADSVERSVFHTVGKAARLVRKARGSFQQSEPRVIAALDAIDDAVRAAEDDLRLRRPLGEIAYSFRQRVDSVARDLVVSDLDAIRADLADLDLDLDVTLPPHESDNTPFDLDALEPLMQRDFSPLSAISSIQRLAVAIDVDHDDEVPAKPATAATAVAQELSTCMGLHAAGWQTAYHPEVLTRRVADRDLSSVLERRLRQAQGAIQVLLLDNPLFKRGLTWPQRLTYSATTWDYLSGFAALVYCLVPAVYLVFETPPVKAYDWELFARLIPFLVVNETLFLIAAHGTSTWRIRQFHVALFPLWIRACITPFRQVAIGDPPSSPAIASDEAEGSGRHPWHLVRWQLVTMVMLVMAFLVGAIQLSRGAVSVLGTSANLLWAVLDLALLSVVIRAVRSRPVASDSLSWLSKGVT